MEGREQKYQKISKYAENTTIQNRWPMILRHELIQLVFFRENCYGNVNYKRKSSNHVQMSRENVCFYCHPEFKSGIHLCVLHDSNFMTEIIKCVDG